MTKSDFKIGDRVMYRGGEIAATDNLPEENAVGTIIGGSETLLLVFFDTNFPAGHYGLAGFAQTESRRHHHCRWLYPKEISHANTRRS